MKVIDNVYLLDGGFVNAYLIVDGEDLVLVDALLQRSGKKIIQQLKDLGFDPKDIKKILITHSDGDHVGGVNAIRKISGAKVYAGQIEADAMAKGDSSRELKPKGLMKIPMALMKMAPKRPVVVDEIIEPGQTLPLLGGLQVVGTPGHTPGHVSFYASEAGVLFAGDSMRAGEDEIRLGNSPMITWDEGKLLGSIQKQAELNPKIVCVGHGPVVVDVAGKFPKI